jgi:hypothetical protein
MYNEGMKRFILTRVRKECPLMKLETDEMILALVSRYGAEAVIDISNCWGSHIDPEYGPHWSPSRVRYGNSEPSEDDDEAFNNFLQDNLAKPRRKNKESLKQKGYVIEHEDTPDDKIHIWRRIVVYKSELSNVYDNDVENLLRVLDDIIYQELEQ